MNQLAQQLQETLKAPALVYLTGSQLTRVNDKKSDTDFYGFYLPDKMAYLGLHDHHSSQEVHNDSYEAKVFPSVHLYSLIAKSNLTIVELFFQRPLVVDTEFTDLAKWLYNNRERLAYVNKSLFVGSAYGMMKNNLARMQPGRVYHRNGSFGKDAYNFLKAYRYASALYNHQALEFEVFQSGDQLQASRQLKSHATFDQAVYNSLNVDELLDDVQHMSADLGPQYEPNAAILEEVANRLPVFK